MSYPIKSIEKIFNTLGHHKIKDLYGLDLTFNIVDIEVLSNIINIKVNFIGDLPYIFRNLSVGDDEWSITRYHDRQHITKILGDILNYVGINNGFVSMEYEPNTNECSKTGFLTGVGWTICLDNGMLDPFMPDRRKLLSHVISGRWWDSLSTKDKKMLKSNFG